jgi:hypothetical protein
MQLKYLSNHKEKTYYTVAVFPMGAKNINITELATSDNFLG